MSGDEQAFQTIGAFSIYRFYPSVRSVAEYHLHQERKTGSDMTWGSLHCMIPHGNSAIVFQQQVFNHQEFKDYFRPSSGIPLESNEVIEQEYQLTIKFLHLWVRQGQVVTQVDKWVDQYVIDVQRIFKAQVGPFIFSKLQ